MTTKRIAGWHRDMARRMRGMPIERGPYDQIVRIGAAARPDAGEGTALPAAGVRVGEILAFFRPCLVEERCRFDQAMRGEAVNHDLYAYSPRERAAIVQARHAFRSYRNGYLNVHKNYFLVGYNELTRAPFRHPVGAAVVRAAVRKHGQDQDAILHACQAWMFDVTPRQLADSVRQGDVLLTPVRGEPAGEPAGTTATLDGHVVEAAEVRRDGALYARDPTIRHAKGQHRTVVAAGWHRVTLAREARAWDFAARVGD